MLSLSLSPLHALSLPLSLDQVSDVLPDGVQIKVRQKPDMEAVRFSFSSLSFTSF